MLLFSVGCETVITDVEVPKIDKKLVFYGGYSNLDMGNTVSLTYSKPVFESTPSSEYEPERNATIYVLGSQDTLHHIYNFIDDEGYQHTSYDFVPGEAYRLEVSTQTGEKISAMEYMPDSVSNFTYQVEHLTGEFVDGMNVKMEFDDDPNQDNFYRFEVFFISSQQEMIKSFVEGEYFDDSNAKDGKLKHSVDAFLWDKNSNQDVFIIISQINKSHYDYGKRLIDYVPNNPFSEPSPLPNNIENGLGLFSLSNAKMIKL